LPNSEEHNNGDNHEFAGTMCLDMQPKDSLNQYFDYEEEDLANYLIYNPDEAFKNEQILDSDFLTYVKKLILTEENYDVDSITAMMDGITPKLFDTKRIMYGIIRINRKNKNYCN
jgi:hypothetical protein